VTDPLAVQGGGGAQGRGAAGGRAGAAGAPAEPQTRPSPDGKWEAYIQNYNIFIRPIASNGGNGGRQGAGRAGGGRQGGGAAAGNAAAQPMQLSWDGSEGNPYQLGGGRGGGGGNGGGNSMWSPDSKKIAAYRVRPGYDRHVTYVRSSPTDQLQPQSFEGALYRKPGDEVPLQQPSLFDVETKMEVVIDNTLFPTPYNLSGIQWRRDSRAFTFDYNQRGHQVYRVIEVDASTGKARAVINETSKTFIYYNSTNATMSPGDTYINSMQDGKEIIWMSQRDGWKHLYLYDGATGQVKNQITKGQWLVHNVERVDEQARQIYFMATGMDAGKDPYLFTYCRINFDGTGLVRYTPADGMHDVPVFSADRQYYVDSYTKVDLPRVAELRKTSDQSLMMTLEKADATDLLATGWKMLEVFTAKGRDGTTDIWGIIIKPTNFDPSKKYPVIENIYAGPQGSFVPKTWSTQAGMQALAELGFIVVQVDGMGTANRSKAFHDVAFKNLGDAGFPDRILWHKAIAAKYPWYDITRVGIYGTSAGGQNSLGGMLFHPEFYKVAVSNSGCHDNRMDKIWWNEQWMSWPLGPEYKDSSNMENAAKLKGKLMLVVPELDTNVDPSSTMQVVNALVKNCKEFELVVIPGADHGAASPITVRKRNDFFVRNLLGLNPPNWNDQAAANSTTSGGDEEPDYAALESLGNFGGS
jgi:dipeptidyl aminopeptidase/acylaminoacyl peptidase